MLCWPKPLNFKINPSYELVFSVGVNTKYNKPLLYLIPIVLFNIPDKYVNGNNWFRLPYFSIQPQKAQKHYFKLNIINKCVGNALWKPKTFTQHHV